MKVVGKVLSYLVGLAAVLLAVSLMFGCVDSCTSGGARDGALATYEQRLGGMRDLGYSKKEAKAILKVMKKVGCGEIEEFLDKGGDGKGVQVNRCTVHGHQVNFTTDGGKVFYIEITGLHRDKVDEFLGKNQMNFVLYDAENVKGGYRAHYSYTKTKSGVKESVVDWDKWKNGKK